MACKLIGKQSWSVVRDDEGHREYDVVHRVEADTPSDGPMQALLTPGLPLPFTFWNFGEDIDPWAWCKLGANVKEVMEQGEPSQFYDVFQKFSTKPLRFDQGVNQAQLPGFGVGTPGGGGNSLGATDPLLDLPKVSGNFVRYTEEATNDRFGRPIRTSSHEPFRGAQNEWDAMRPTVRVEFNSPFLELELLTAAKDTVNDRELWGVPRRCIKFVPVSWDRQFHGIAQVLYKYVIDFEINFKTWDRDFLDEGTKVLRGKWDKDPDSPTFHQWIVARDADNNELNSNNPKNFVRFKDWHDENTKVVLNGDGRPFDPDQAPYYNDTGLAGTSTRTPRATGNAEVSAPTGLTMEVKTPGSLMGGVQYRYKVSSLTQFGESAPSGEVAATLSSDEHGVRLTWNQVTGATGYKVYRKREEGFGIEGDFDFGLLAIVGSVNTPGNIHVEKYEESNFLAFGIPLFL